MLLFWFFATLLMAAALAALLWPLLRKRDVARAPDATGAAVAVYRDQKRSLDSECAAGAITSGERDAALTELARRVAEDVEAAPAAATHVTRRAWWPAIALSLLVPAAAFLLYGRLGNPGAAAVATIEGGRHEISEQQIVAMVDGLAQRLKQHPEDADGWVLLAHSYQTLGRFAEAADAYAHADLLMGDNPSLLADYADALAMAQSGRLAGKPATLVQRALAIDPKHQKALALAATIALQAHDIDGSIAYWRRLAAELPSGSEEARQVALVIAKVEAAKRENKSGAAAPARGPSSAERSPQRKDPDSKALAGAISGHVDIDPALAPEVALSDTVFIFARASEGPRMPLAVLRLPARELPKDFSLDDSMGMAPGVKLSGAATVVVEARISKSGNASPQPGDLFGRSVPVRPGATGLNIRIDQVVR